VITDGDVTVAESGAIIEYIIDRYGKGRMARSRRSWEVGVQACAREVAYELLRWSKRDLRASNRFMAPRQK
jgi:glutathione S-transferase